MSNEHTNGGSKPNGVGGVGGGADGPPASAHRSRSGATTTVNIATLFREAFDTFVKAGYRIAALEGPRGIDARRQLVERIAGHRHLMDEWMAVLQAEIIDMTRGQDFAGNPDNTEGGEK